MIRAFTLSIGQLGDRAILIVLVKSLLVTLAIFAALGVGLYLLLDQAFAAWADGTGLIVAASVVIGLGAAWLLFRIVGIAVVGVFADDVVAAVEARHYPAALASARPVRFHRAAMMGLRSAARALLVNLVMLPLYVVALFTVVGPAVLFFLVNAWLLARDLGDMVASRHLDDAAMRGWRKATGGRRYAMGLVVTGLFVVPVVNILAPVIGAAMATHLFHGGKT